MKKFKELLLAIYLILNMLYVLVGSYLVISKVINIWKFSRGEIFLLILNIVVLIILFIINKIKKRLKFNITDIFLLLMVIFGIISVIFAVKPKVALFGFSGRYEGFFQLLYYYSVYLLSTFVDKKYKKIVVYGLLFCGLVEAVYAILQKTQWLIVITQFHHKSPWATAFITNPNFFGSLMILCLSFSLGLFIDLNKFYFKIINGLLVFLFMVGLLMSNTLSALVGLFVVFIYILVYVIKQKKFKDFMIIIFILLSTSVLIHVSKKTYLLEDIIIKKNQTVDIAHGKMDDSYGSNRIYIWKNTLKVVPENFWNGVGIDNYYYAFGKKPLSMKGWFFDKAHNEYLQILVCEGIFALVSYLLLFGWVTIKGMINSFKNKEIYLVLPVIGYLVQAFFNISVIEVAPFFYISLGLLLERDKFFS